MKTEDAINILKNAVFLATNNNAEEIEEAVQMAVTALEMQSKSEWISVKDRLPSQDGKYIVVVAGDKLKTRYVITWWFFNGSFEPFEYFPTRYVSHWMHLPKPPKEEDDDTQT